MQSAVFRGTLIVILCAIPGLGAIGIVLGPILAAVLDTVVNICRRAGRAAAMEPAEIVEAGRRVRESLVDR